MLLARVRDVVVLFFSLFLFVVLVGGFVVFVVFSMFAACSFRLVVGLLVGWVVSFCCFLLGWLVGLCGWLVVLFLFVSRCGSADGLVSSGGWVGIGLGKERLVVLGWLTAAAPRRRVGWWVGRGRP